MGPHLRRARAPHAAGVGADGRSVPPLPDRGSVVLLAGRPYIPRPSVMHSGPGWDTLLHHAAGRASGCPARRRVGPRPRTGGLGGLYGPRAPGRARPVRRPGTAQAGRPGRTRLALRWWRSGPGYLATPRPVQAGL